MLEAAAAANSNASSSDTGPVSSDGESKIISIYVLIRLYVLDFLIDNGSSPLKTRMI